MRYDDKNNKLDRALKCALHVDVEPDDALHRKVLCNLKGERAMRIRKYKAAVAVVAAIVGITMVSGGVYAAVTNSSLLESFRNRGNQVSKEAERLVDREPKIEMLDNQGKDLQYINYTVDEVVCDDYTLYTRVTVTPKDTDKYTLFGDDITKADLDDSVSILGIEGETEGTIGEYAKREGRKIVRVSFSYGWASNSKTPEISEWYEYGKDGELYCYSSIQDTPGLDTYTEKLCIHEYKGFEEDEHGSEFVKVTVDNKSYEKNKKEYKTVDDNLDYGIKVNKISVISTELGTYLTIEHTPQIKYGASGKWGAIVPGIFDEDGNEIQVMEGGHGKNESGRSIWKLNYGTLDMGKMFIGFRRTYDIHHDKIDESVIGPYALEEVK